MSALTPLDLQARMGLGNLIPGTGMLKPSNDKKFADVLEIIGPVGGLAQAYINTADAVGTGNWSRASTEWMPKAFRDLARGADMMATGEARDARGRKVVDATPLDALVKMIGFNPQDVASEGRNIRGVQQKIDFAKRKEGIIAERWARGIVEGSSADIASARAALNEWNESNPDTPISIKRSQVQRRVKEMKSTKEQRFLKSATKDMRGYAQEAIE
jgi:hypothetical protein